MLDISTAQRMSEPSLRGERVSDANEARATNGSEESERSERRKRAKRALQIPLKYVFKNKEYLKLGKVRGSKSFFLFLFLPRARAFFL